MTDSAKHSGSKPEWLLKMADAEDSCRSISVGGMAADLGMLPPIPDESHRVFGRLVAFARRAKGLTLEQLAQHADVDLAEILEIERNDDTIPQLRTVYQLAHVLGLSAGGLVEVAGLATPRPEVSDAALRFAARSEPTATLAAAERDAFEEFVKVLADVSEKR